MKHVFNVLSPDQDWQAESLPHNVARTAKLICNVNVSVVIPCLNEQAHIAAAIESAWAAGVLEVIVVDGGSNDDTPRIASENSAQVVSCTPGRAVQMNAGAAKARGNVLLFLHADCRLPVDARRQIADAFSKPEQIWGAFRQRIVAQGLIYRAIEWGNGARVHWQGSAYGDQAIFVRRKTFDAVGGFDEVPLMEDVLLSRKLGKIARPQLLDGPIIVNARRWQRYGPIRQTLRNWWLMIRFRCGANSKRLAELYRRHDSK